MSHTRKGGQASYQDSNSGQAGTGNHSGQVGSKAPTKLAGLAHNRVTLGHRHQPWPVPSTGPAILTAHNTRPLGAVPPGARLTRSVTL